MCNSRSSKSFELAACMLCKKNKFKCEISKEREYLLTFKDSGRFPFCYLKLLVKGRLKFVNTISHNWRLHNYTKVKFWFLLLVDENFLLKGISGVITPEIALRELLNDRLDISSVV